MPSGPVTARGGGPRTLVEQARGPRRRAVGLLDDQVTGSVTRGVVPRRSRASRPATTTARTRVATSRGSAGARSRPTLRSSCRRPLPGDRCAGALRRASADDHGRRRDLLGLGLGPAQLAQGLWVARLGERECLAHHAPPVRARRRQGVGAHVSIVVCLPPGRLGKRARGRTAGGTASRSATTRRSEPGGRSAASGQTVRAVDPRRGRGANSRSSSSSTSAARRAWHGVTVPATTPPSSSPPPGASGSVRPSPKGSRPSTSDREAARSGSGSTSVPWKNRATA